MPRYFFDTDDGDRIFHDRDGIELPDADAATDEARKLAFDLFYGAPRIGRTIIACVVKDEVGGVADRLMMDSSGEVGPSADPASPA